MAGVFQTGSVSWADSLNARITHDVTRTVRAFRNRISAVRSTFISTVLQILFLPLFILLWFLYEMAILMFNSLNFKGIILDKSSYKEFHILAGTLKGLSCNLREKTDSTENFIFRIFAKQDARIIHISHRHLADLSEKFAELDKTAAPLPVGWKVLTSEEHWKDRPAPYEYII